MNAEMQLVMSLDGNTSRHLPCKVVIVLLRITIFLFFYMCLVTQSLATDQKNLLYEVQWHRLINDSAGQIYMQGALPVPLLLYDSTDLPTSAPLSSGRTAVAVNLLDESVDSLNICVKTHSWWTENPVEALDFHGRRKAAIKLPAAIEPACSSLVDGYGNKRMFIPEGTSSWSGLLDLIIFEISPFKTASTSFPKTHKSRSWLTASSGATGDSFWHDPKWRFYPGFIQPSLGYLDIFPLWTNPFVLLRLHPDSHPTQNTEGLVIHFINEDGTDTIKTITQNQFDELTEEMSVTHPDLWKRLAGNEVSVRVSTITNLSEICVRSQQLSAEVHELANKLLYGPVQSPVTKEQKKSEEQSRTDSSNRADQSQHSPTGSLLPPVSTGGRNLEDGAGGEKQPPEGFESVSVASDDDQRLVDTLVTAAETGDVHLVEALVLQNGNRLLFGLHSVSGESALTAAIKARQEFTLIQIQNLCRDDEYFRLLLLPNKQNQTPMSLFEIMKYPDSVWQPQDVDSQASMVTDSYNAIPSEITSQPHSRAPHPLIEHATTLHLEDPCIEECFQKYNLDVKQYNDPTCQEESIGRRECVVHPGFNHAEVELACCGNFVCQSVVIALARKMISGFIRNHDDRIDCPGCRKPLNLVMALDKLKEDTEQRIIVESSRPVDLWLRIISRSSDNPSLAFYSEIKAFVEDILTILWDHVHIKKHFEQRVAFLENAKCEICMETTNCIQLSREQECTHRFCPQCLKTYLRSSATNLNALSTGILTCPGTDCPVPIPDYVVQAITGKHILKKLHTSLLKLAASKNKHLFICLNPDCDNVMDIQDACSSKVVCGSCNQASCSQCLVTPYHEGWSCQMYKTALTSHGAEAMFEAAKKREPHKFKKCPVCNADIYKEMGCNLIHCSKCHEKFCWECHRVITQENYRHFQGGKCELWEKPLHVNHFECAIGEAAGGRGKHRMERYCQRCHSENMLEQWMCGHYFCAHCQDHMIREAERLGKDFDRLCPGCFGKEPKVKRQKIPDMNSGNDELSPEASAYTPAPVTTVQTGQVQSCHLTPDKSNKKNPKNKQCWICGLQFGSFGSDICGACLSEILD